MGCSASLCDEDDDRLLNHEKLRRGSPAPLGSIDVNSKQL